MEQEEDWRDKYNTLKRVHETLRVVAKDNREKATKLEELNSILVLKITSAETENKMLREEHFEDKKQLMIMRTRLAEALNELRDATIDLATLK